MKQLYKSDIIKMCISKEEKMIVSKKKSIQRKKNNTIIVLDLIIDKGRVIKSYIAEKTGLSVMATNNIVTELENMKLVVEDGYDVGAVGRRPITYILNKDYAYCIGIHVSVNTIRGALINLHGDFVYKNIINIESGNNVLEVINDLIQDIISQSNEKKDKIIGIGVGVPGPVDMERGMTLYPPNMPDEFRFLPLKECIQNKFGIKCFVNKDTNVIALGEFWKGSGQEHKDMIYIDVDMGIGSGIVIDGQLVEGINSGAGEIGHLTIDINGPKCNCGAYGCLEAIASGIAIEKKIRDEIDKGTNISINAKEQHVKIYDVTKAATNNDPYAIHLLNESARNVGVAIGGIINMFDIEMIILGGILIEEYEPYFRIVNEYIQLKKIKSFTKNIITKSTLHLNSGVIGAASLAIADYFHNELFDKLSNNNK